ncbi:related to Galactokinase [Zygosaccharomyces bailii]|nr:related to Galactokinase [Zygosaccharomyces bailii]
MYLCDELMTSELSMEVPVYCLDKCSEVTRRFFETYAHDADFVARSPGRVNIIGDHIDYCNFSVLPMAIDVEMLCAVRVLPHETSITLTNADPRFAQRQFDLPLEDSLGIDPATSDWSNYFKCGLLVAHKFLQAGSEPLHDVGMQVFCQGSVPTGGGLSSSAAFICATALATIRAHRGRDCVISKQDLTRITVDAEHYLGINNGGMDQCASVCGQRDHAMYVEFKPILKATPFPLPRGVQFVVSNTLVVSNKFETAPTNYNLRVVECTIAASIIAKRYGITLKGDRGPGDLRDVIDTYCDGLMPDLRSGLEGVDQGIARLATALDLVEETLGPKSKGYTTAEAADALGMSPAQFTTEYLTVFPVRFHTLQLYNRAKHVFSEALRVLLCLRLMTRPVTDTQRFLTTFGALMNESQSSCRDFCDCSCEETEQISQIALENGAYGSRLTGAGWGGCTISLCHGEESVLSVKKALHEQYYNKRFPHLSQRELEAAIIISKPEEGSALYEHCAAV